MKYLIFCMVFFSGCDLDQTKAVGDVVKVIDRPFYDNCQATVVRWSGFDFKYEIMFKCANFTKFEWIDVRNVR